MPKHFWCIYNRKDAKVPNFGVKVESMCVLESSYERLQQQQQDSFIIWCTQNYSNTFTCVLQFRHQYTSIYTIYWDSCLQRDSLTIGWLLVDIAVKIEELYSLQITILILISDFQINWKARSLSTCTWTRWRGWRSSRTRRRGSCASSCSASSPSSSRPGTTSAEKVKTQTHCVTDIGDCRLSANVVLLGRLVEV